MKMHPNRQKKYVQNLNIKQTWKQKHAYLENDQRKYKKSESRQE